MEKQARFSLMILMVFSLGELTRSNMVSKKKNLKNCSKEDAEYSEHINRIMNSPPKKKILNIPKWGGGIPISSPNHHVMNHNSNTFSQPQTTYTKINNGANKSLRISMLN